MLSPDDIDLAGDKVAAVYTQIESEMLDYLVDQLLDGNVLDQKSTTALTLLAQTHAPKLREIIANNQDAIDQAALETATEYLKMSDADDIARLGEGTPMWPQQVKATVSGISQVLARNNLRMAEGAKQAFLNASIEAVTQVNTGNKTTEKALHAAVRNLERNGISVVNYQNAATGIRTVTNAVDVAVRRHIRTQIAQDGARMTLERLNDMDVALVEVSSHEGARPTHAVWQGRCYSLHGTVKIDGVTYNDFYTSTNYGAVDGLLGANCRHSFGPYKHGAKRFYSPDPKHPSGLSNDEVYNLTQKQRYYERQIRAAKRELRGAQQIYDKQGGIEALTELSKAKDKLASRQSAMRAFIEESNAKCKKGTSVLTRHPNREWAGDMPKIASKNNTITKATKPATIKKANQIKTATTTAEAVTYAQKLGVYYANYSDLPLEAANICNRAIATLPENLRPRSVTSAKSLEKAMDRKFGNGRTYHGITINESANFYLITKNRSDLDMETGWRVGINIGKNQNLDSIATKKSAFNNQYKKETGRTWYFNESGESVAYHEMGHVYEKQVGLPNGFEADAARWASEAKCDMLTSPNEAWAEAWGAYHTGNKELPSYISKYIEEATETKVTASKKGSGAFDSAGSFEPIRLSKQEYASIQSEIRTNLSKEQKQQEICVKAIGDYIYTFVNNWPDDAIIIGKIPIDSGWDK